MAKLSWSAGGPDRVAASVRTTEDRLIPMAVEIVTETVEDGARVQEIMLNEATTQYGEARYGRGRGGSAGRNDTGRMIRGISTKVYQTDESVIGTWGWEDPEDYFLEQEHGIGVPAADSLWKSFIPTREAFFRRILSAVRSS